MAGLFPAIHALLFFCLLDVDARHKAGHDGIHSLSNPPSAIAASTISESTTSSYFIACLMLPSLTRVATVKSQVARGSRPVVLKKRFLAKSRAAASSSAGGRS